MKQNFLERVYDQRKRLIVERPYEFDRLFCEGQVIEIEGKKATVISCNHPQGLLVVTTVMLDDSDTFEDLGAKTKELKLNKLIQSLVGWWVLASIGVAHYVIQFITNGPLMFPYMGKMLLCASVLLLFITVVLLWKPLAIGLKIVNIICWPVKCVLRFVFRMPDKVEKLKKWSQDL